MEGEIGVCGGGGSVFVDFGCVVLGCVLCFLGVLCVMCFGMCGDGGGARRGLAACGVCFAG